MAAHATPRRKARSESFLGVHFDFHAGDDCKSIGHSVTPEMVEAILDAVKPDYVQSDCKGHPGLSSYPTQVGHQAPGFEKDTLRIWREVTARRGVSLFMHYSGVWDTEAISRHPDWARIDENGKADPHNVSVFGPYADGLLVPQLKELAGEYGVDGAWIDGECWATCQDYAPAVIAAFEAQTGLKLDPIPKKLGDPLFFEFTEFCREGFRQYLRHYIAAVRATHPGFQIASNWAFSSFMPEPVTADVDYISGDYTMQNSVNSARLEGRCMQRQGKPWDLMAWAFSSRWEDECRSTKSVAQLSQEAAVVLALGGGFQAYFTQKRDGGVRLWQMQLMGEVAKFCRAREALCHKAQSVPEASVALLLSSEDYYHRNPRIFSPWSGELLAIRGVLQALLESQFHVEIVSEHHLRGRMSEYPIIVNPEWSRLAEGFRDELKEYVRGGGNLLLIGPGAAKPFERELGVTLGTTQEGIPDAGRWVESDGWLGGLTTPPCPVELGATASPRGRLYHENDTQSASDPAASVTALGEGRIAATYFNLGRAYTNASTQAPRRFLAELVRELVPQPMVEVSGTQYIDVTVMQKDGRMLVNLVNTAGPHADEKVYTFDEIPAIGPVTVKVRLPEAPSAVALEPVGITPTWSFADGLLRVEVPQVACHEVVVIDPAVKVL